MLLAEELLLAHAVCARGQRALAGGAVEARLVHGASHDAQRRFTGGDGLRARVTLFRHEGAIEVLPAEEAHGRVRILVEVPVRQAALAHRTAHALRVQLYIGRAGQRDAGTLQRQLARGALGRVCLLVAGLAIHAGGLLVQQERLRLQRRQAGAAYETPRVPVLTNSVEHATADGITAANTHLARRQAVLGVLRAVQLVRLAVHGDRLSNQTDAAS